VTIRLSQFPDELIADASFHHGLMVIPLGDDGDVAIILGHHDDRRAVAALNRFCRLGMGHRNMYDAPEATYADACADLSRLWAKLITQCSAADEHWHVDGCVTCAAIREAIKDNNWCIGYDFAQDDPGVFPVMVWQA
jgi:hypothetical protein